ncbi:hypothetical protein LHJ74_00870 [Streptomyces sp. N2-109]|uniref:Uridine kinase n=1 Tax=Streptomyces gossypii TaxID=2883101 RepID=A0ABT2JKV0_9ACTN|nr:hypothetical protein [Streptomyces gossypii]MCT2588509.1 hypothetical protein [Streptomyces gossypii]
MDDPGGPGDLRQLARRLAALPPSCGPVRLIAVDGYAGSGKSTFAARLAAALDGAPVLHLDDLSSHEALFDWTGRFAEQVTGPLSRGSTARFGIYDWKRHNFTRTGELPPARAVLVEGVGAGRRALRPELACLLWMDVPRVVAHERGMRRDGPGQAAFWDLWRRAEAEHFAADPSLPHADLLIREGLVGPEVLPGQRGMR